MQYRHPKKYRSQFERSFAIGDIHGCFGPFVKLLDKIELSKKDLIIILGDLIDRGHDSAKVLDLVISLKNEGYEIYPLMGNHEIKLLEAFNCGIDFFEKHLDNYNSSDLLGDNLEDYLELISNFDYCLEYENFFLSHTGIVEGAISPLNDIRGMFPKIRFQFNLNEIREKIQIHGHWVKSTDEIRISVRQKLKKFSIDSGCFLNTQGFGYLTAIELNSMELFHQK